VTAKDGEAQTVLRLDNITKRFGALTANDGIGFSLKRGEVLALLGENGAGKTTLMNILFGHYTADAGTVEVFGRPLAPGNPRAALEAGVGMVHQHFTLADNLTVLENIALGTAPLWKAGLGRRAARDRIREAGCSRGRSSTRLVPTGLTTGVTPGPQSTWAVSNVCVNAASCSRAMASAS